MEYHVIFLRVTYCFAAAFVTSLASDEIHATSHSNGNPTHTDQEWPEAEFIGSIANVTVARGRDAVLSASLTHSNNHSVGWLRTNQTGEGSRLNTVLAMGRNIVIHDARFIVESPDEVGSPVWKLNIKNVKPEDAGMYMAQISNTDPIKSQTAYVTVLEPPNIDDSATPSQYEVREGEPVEIECRASGLPAPTITWRREDGVPIANDSCQFSKTTGKGYGRFCLLKAERLAMGSYLCIASNGIAPTTSKRIQLFVHFLPVVKTDKPVIGSQAAADFVSMDCTVESSPHVNYFWYKDDHAITGVNKRYSITENKLNAYTVQTTLTIRNIRSDDAGVYRCIAGDKEATVRVYVFQPTTKPTTSTVTPLPAVKASTHRPTFATRAVVSSPTTRVPLQDLIYRNQQHVAPERSSSVSAVNASNLLLATSFLAIHKVSRIS